MNTKEGDMNTHGMIATHVVETESQRTTTIGTRAAHDIIETIQMEAALVSRSTYLRIRHKTTHIYHLTILRTNIEERIHLQGVHASTQVNIAHQEARVQVCTLKAGARMNIETTGGDDKSCLSLSIH